MDEDDAEAHRPQESDAFTSPLPGKELPAHAASGKKESGDFFQLSVTQTGDVKSYSVTGFKGANKELCRLILCFGLAAALTVASVVYVLHVLVPGPMREKVYSGLGIAATTTIVLIWSRVKHWITKQAKRRMQRRRGQVSDDGGDHG
jgi:hypothetical protein